MTLRLTAHSKGLWHSLLLCNTPWKVTLVIMLRCDITYWPQTHKVICLGFKIKFFLTRLLPVFRNSETLIYCKCNLSFYKLHVTKCSFNMNTIHMYWCTGDGIKESQHILYILRWSNLNSIINTIIWE